MRPMTCKTFCIMNSLLERKSRGDVHRNNLWKTISDLSRYLRPLDTLPRSRSYGRFSETQGSGEGIREELKGRQRPEVPTSWCWVVWGGSRAGPRVVGPDVVKGGPGPSAPSPKPPPPRAGGRRRRRRRRRRRTFRQRGESLRVRPVATCLPMWGPDCLLVSPFT